MCEAQPVPLYLHPTLYDESSYMSWQNYWSPLFVLFLVFICLHQVLVVTQGIFNLHLGMWDLVSWPGIEPRCPALEAQSLSHWTTRKSLATSWQSLKSELQHLPAHRYAVLKSPQYIPSVTSESFTITQYYITESLQIWDFHKVTKKSPEFLSPSKFHLKISHFLPVLLKKRGKSKVRDPGSLVSYK